MSRGRSIDVSSHGAVSMRRVCWTTHSDREGTDEVASVQIATSRQGAVRRGPPLRRHLAAVGVTLVLMLLFSWVKRDPDGTDFPLQLSQDILADTSFALLCLVPV